MHMRSKAFAWTLALVTVMLTAMTLASEIVCADMNGDNGRTIPSARVTIPVRHLIAGDEYTGKTGSVFVLTAEEDKCPMPEGSSGRIKAVHVQGESDPDFGEIVLDYPDAYYYTVSREGGSNELDADMESYRVLIAKLNDGSADMVIWDSHGRKTDEIVYLDNYTAPVRRAPATGDSEMRRQRIVWMFAGVSSLAGLLLAVMLSSAGRERKRQLRGAGGGRP